MQLVGPLLGLVAYRAPARAIVGFFAKTDMYWKVNHMLVPTARALECNDRHGEKGRIDWAAIGH